MKVKVSEDTTLVYEDKVYKSGDELEMIDKFAKVQIQAGNAVEVKAKKGKK